MRRRRRLGNVVRIEEYRLRLRVRSLAREVAQRRTLDDVEAVADDEEFVQHRVVVDVSHRDARRLQIFQASFVEDDHDLVNSSIVARCFREKHNTNFIMLDSCGFRLNLMAELCSVSYTGFANCKERELRR